ncbi:formimidoylglutamate deiminase [Thalassorhabdomicrobium marinisediminis]|uniref:Formimidoylglutamate deiminase n=1 Tax=Thalassorhabdomicrobium marinisediminis TaxID=2170577 RepID=A0A2T7G157_9RHOB|nr:formimidoylglutamate deiminase [Thalassorhabdomicrobium marinisediminis]PVA08152.1 formimidoylglutamate deiminase [Thalassorhabdomicrobium marinisediminis]
MQTIWAETALLPQGWASDVRIGIDGDGRIDTVGTRMTPQAGDARVPLLLPAPVNLHSHAFQRAMAGLTEQRGPDPQDSFWTWRQLMFRFLDQLTPAQIEAITAFVQMEMLEAGYGASVEFHYLHHQPGGAPYDDLAETSARVVAAADTSGIGLCLLPVHYQFGGCDGRALAQGQARFGNDLDRFQALHDGAKAHLAHAAADATLGAAPHSIRAVGVEDLRRYSDLFPTGPLHMHLAEQRAEVEEVQQHLRARPVDWALENMALDDRWCLIHCTQMTPEETVALAGTGAVAGLCPITESSLGDGIFDAVRWLHHDGAIGIGSDSNIRVALSEELRTLEYSQRLRDGTRAALATADRSTGRRLFSSICAGGAQAAGRRTGRIEAGFWADLMTLDTTSEHLWGKTRNTALDAWIFAGDDRLVRDVWSAGRHLVTDGQHIARGPIVAAYKRALDDLKDAL